MTELEIRECKKVFEMACEMETEALQKGLMEAVARVFGVETAVDKVDSNNYNHYYSYKNGGGSWTCDGASTTISSIYPGSSTITLTNGNSTIGSYGSTSSSSIN